MTAKGWRAGGKEGRLEGWKVGRGAAEQLEQSGIDCRRRWRPAEETHCERNQVIKSPNHGTDRPKRYPREGRLERQRERQIVRERERLRCALRASRQTDGGGGGS